MNNFARYMPKYLPHLSMKRDKHNFPQQIRKTMSIHVISDFQDVASVAFTQPECINLVDAVTRITTHKIQ